MTRRELMQAGLAGLSMIALDGRGLQAGQHASSAQEFSLHYDHVLGTFLDAWGFSRDEDVAARN